MENGKQVKTVKYIWELMKYRPWLYLVNCILWMLIHISPLIPGLIAKEFFDKLTKNATLDSSVWGLLVLIVIVAISRVVLISLGGRVDSLHRFTMSALVRRNMLECILEKPGAKSIPTTIGEAINCFRDDAQQAEDSISWTLDIIGSAVFAVTAVVILLNINLKITLFVFTPLVIVVALAQKASEKIAEFRSASRVATADVSGAIGEIFNSVQAIKVEGAEKSVLNYLSELNEKRHKQTLRDSLLNQLMESFYQNTVGFGTGLILLFAGRMIKSGSFSVGDFALFVYYLAFVADFTQFFGTFLAHYKQTGVSFKRMEVYLQGEDCLKLVKHSPVYLKKNSGEYTVDSNRKPETLKTLEVKSLCYSYRESLSCAIGAYETDITDAGIKNISFSISKGQFTVICGRIGSGKTTLLKTFLGLLPKASGEIYWNGKLVTNESAFFTPPVSAYTSQIPNLFSDTIQNNILLGIEENSVDLHKIINQAVLEKDIPTMENGLNTVIGSKGVKLSGGQAQRVAAARMFAREAELYIFDDISSALDIETECLLWERLFEKKTNPPSCLVVSNRKFALEKADQVIVMKDGQIEAIGKLEELLKSSQEMQQIWGIEQIA
jgi:ATP-binding cassette, subfamily B, bacterial